jgi:PBP1b-binding outer membrane lipoprotein LpoB
MLSLIILIFTTVGCANKQTPKDEKLSVAENQENTVTIFRQVADFSTIKDTTKFITDLQQIFGLEVDKSSSQK